MEIPEKGALPPLTGSNPLTDERPGRLAKGGTVLETDGRDTVSLTAKGREFKAAFDQARSLPDIRLERVQLLRQQLEKGTYRVEADRIAVGMIDETVENNSALKHIDTKV
jgi:flagellar biosynthesis anti-sigma factor FlgM